jgi:cysteine desulfurase family protein
MTPDSGVAYLDYAATAAIRPDAVASVMVEYLRTVGATPGRGGHRLAVEADRIALRCRQSLVRLLDIPGDPGRIAFFPNATYAINAALHGILIAGDRVVTTTYDHNAVLRPVAALQRARALDVRMVEGDVTGRLDTDTFRQAVRGAKLVVLNAVSNVIGTALAIQSLAKTAHAEGALVLVDAAQAAGELPVSISEWDADLVAFTGHKGLLGPQGTGGLWVREGVGVTPFATGGTGGDSADREMPVAYPDHLEAGTSNGVGIAGLGGGVDWLLDRTVEAVHAHTMNLGEVLRRGLAGISGVRVLSPETAAVAIVTFTVDGMDATSVTARLDREHGVLSRGGLHCAPEVHRLLGTDRTGAVRFSPGWATTAADIERAITGVKELAAGRP